MTKGSPLRRAISAALIILLCYAPLTHSIPQVSAQGEQPGVHASVSILVEEGGNATVVITFRARANVSFSFTLPKFDKYTVCSSYGGYSIQDNPSSAYFYFNSSIRLTPGSNGTAILSVCYNFPYATLLSENRGWFMSPMLVSYPALSIEVYVRIPGLASVTLETPPADRVLGAGYRVYTLSPSRPQIIPGRVIIEYTTLARVENTNFTASVPGARITVEGPKYYAGLAGRILGVASKAYESLAELSRVSMPALYFKLYLPQESMGGISTLGFVMGEDINAGGRGPIMLNLALLRYAPGYLETTVVHEVVHAFLGKAGVEANDETRWFHEGLAQYLSIAIAENSGYNVSEYAEELLNASQKLFRYVSGNLSFIERWPSSPDLAGEAYLASYYIVYNITTTYGGISYVKALFASIKKYGKVQSIGDIVLVLSEAAGENLAPLFRGWGFKGVVDWSPKTGVAKPQATQQTRNPTFSTLVLLLGIMLAVAAYALNNRVQREIKVARAKSVFEKNREKPYSIFVT